MPRTPLGTMASKYGHGSGDISSFYGAAQQVSCPNRPFGRWADVGQRKNGRSGGNFLSAIGRAWAVLGGIPSGWGQFGAVKKWAVLIGGLRRQLNALYIASTKAGRVFGLLGLLGHRPGSVLQRAGCEGLQRRAAARAQRLTAARSSSPVYTSC